MCVISTVFVTHTEQLMIITGIYPFQPVCELERQFLLSEKPSVIVGECMDPFYSAGRCFQITPVHQMFQCIFSVKVCHFNVKI